MRELAIHTVGGGYYLIDIFNYLAAFTGSKNFSALLYAALVAGILVAAFQLAVFGSPRRALTYFAGVLLVISLGTGPKARVVILDSTVPNGIYGVVDNVPWSVAWIGSLTSGAGHAMTGTMETLLAAPENVSYQRSGMMFGATLMSQAARWRAITPIFHQTLVRFMESCMVTGQNLGHVDSQELMRTGDLVTFISNNNPRSLAFYNPVLEKLQTCTEGWPDVLELAEAEAQRILYEKSAAHYQNAPGVNPFAAAGQLSDTMADFQGMIGMAAQSSLQTVMQSMLAIGLDDSVKYHIAVSGNNAAMTAYQTARSEAQTRASYSAVGISALKWVPLLKIVFETLYYAAFPLAMVMMMTPLVWQVLKGYLGGFVWLAAWDPLSAILHATVLKAGAGYYREAMGSYSNDGNLEYVLSFANHLGVRAVEQDVGVVAGYLMMSVPFIATVIMFGSGRVAGLATSMLNVSQGAAIETGREAATGNVSLSNVSMNNRMSNKHNLSELNDTGLRQERLASGVMVNRNADGSLTYESGTGVSRVAVSPQFRRALSEEMSEARDTAIRTAQSRFEELSSAVNKVAQDYADFGRSLSEGSTASDDKQSSVSTSQRLETQRAQDIITKFAQDNGITSDETYKLGLTLGAGLSAKLGRIGGDATAQITGIGSERQSAEDVYRKAENYAQSREEARTLSDRAASLDSAGIEYAQPLADLFADILRRDGYSTEQIADLLNPNDIQEYARTKETVDAYLPEFLAEYGVTAPVGDLVREFELTRPDEHSPDISGISDNGTHAARMQDAELRHQGEHIRAEWSRSMRSNQVETEGRAVRSDVQSGMERGAIGSAADRLGGSEPAEYFEDVVGRIVAGGAALSVPAPAAPLSPRNQGKMGNHIPWNRGPGAAMAAPLSEHDRDIAIRTIYGEAYGQGDPGLIAVAHVIRNRVADPRWGNNAAEVSLEQKQFSAWLPPEQGGNHLPGKISPADQEYQHIGRLLDHVWAGNISDPTGGATHYYSPKGMQKYVADGIQSNDVPTWFARETDRRGGSFVEIGDHYFTGRARRGG